MNVLVLRNIFTPVADTIRKHGDNVVENSELIDLEFLKKNKIEFIVSHGYRHIVKLPIINFMRNHIINLHISLLPWNRGADPNLWSFLENTPKGVTIHYLDEGVDTGDIIAQRGVIFENDGETLSTTYQRLQNEIIELFEESWPQIRKLHHIGQRQEGTGSFHKLIDKKKFEHFLTDGWNTPVSALVGKGLKSE